MKHRRLVAALVAGVSLPALAACTDNSSGAGKSDARTISVTSSDDACDLSADQAPSGNLVFKVKNNGSKVTEFYLFGEDGLRIVGEVENIGPGLSRDLVVNVAGREVRHGLQAGHGRRRHPHLLHGHRLRATRPPSPAPRKQQVDAANAQYKAYVEDQSEQLLAGTKEFVAAYKSGDDAKARTLYPTVRVHWERIEPVAESFGDLDPKMDVREADLEEGQEWTGWHRIEKDLWPPKDQPYTALTPEKRKDYAERLLQDTQTLHGRIEELTFTVDQIGNGAKSLLDEVATGKVTGEEEIWSHTDLYDFQANVDGARVAFEGLRPVLEAKEPALEKQLEQRFTELQALLDKYRVGADGLRELRRAHHRPGQGALRRRQRALRAALPPDRRGHPLSAMTDSSSLSRRRLLGYAGAGAAVGAAGFAGGIGYGARDRRPGRSGHRPLPVPRQAPGRHRHAGPGPAALRRVRRDRDVAGRAADAPQGVDRRGGRDDPGPSGRGGHAAALRRAARRHRRGDRAAPRRLTLTFGFGPSLFRDAEGKDRFGLADRQPAALRRLPHFPADNLQEQRSDGDLCVQACADDPQVAVHAIRNLSRIAFGSAALRWSQLGFGRTSSTSTSQATPRNLFGFKDGTANLKAEQSADVEKHVWVGADDDGASWLENGSYLVARRINMTIEPWDRTSLREQEQLIGRDRPQGAPLSGGTEFTEPDLDLKGNDGQPLVAMNSHVRLAHPSQNHGVRMLRRGYNFTDGNDDLGRLDAGLFFIAYVRDPDTQYIPMQTKLSRDDGLMEYLRHTGSALFAVPPGVRRGGFVGESLFS